MSDHTEAETSAWERAWFDEFFTDAPTLRERFSRFFKRWRHRANRKG